MARQNHIFKKIRSGSQAERLARRLMSRSGANEGISISTVGAMDKAGMGLKLACPSCGFETVLRGAEMIEKFGEETALAEIRPACPSCGKAPISVLPA